MLTAIAAHQVLQAGQGVGDRANLYRLGREAFADGLAYGAALGRIPGEVALGRMKAVEGWTVPSFPLSGRDVVEQGVDRGPRVGVLLRDIERWWIAEDFAPDAEELRRRLQMMVAAQQ